MKLIKGGNEPATKDDVRELEATIISCCLATGMVQYFRSKDITIDEATTSMYFTMMEQIIAKTRTRLLLDEKLEDKTRSL